MSLGTFQLTPASSRTQVRRFPRLGNRRQILESPARQVGAFFLFALAFLPVPSGACCGWRTRDGVEGLVPRAAVLFAVRLPRVSGLHDDGRDKPR
jgi:hypothetical protein